MIHMNVRATLKAPLCHLSGEQHTWYEDGNAAKKRVVRLHMRKHLNHPSTDGLQRTLVPTYQGNSWRGLLRYHLGLTILDQLVDQGIPITKDLFSIFLSSGGLISAKSEKDPATKSLQTFYEQYPTYWLLGGTFRGKLNRGHSSIGDWIPVCTEAIQAHLVPDSLSSEAVTIASLALLDGYRTPLTNISMITRRDPKLRPDLLKLVEDKELTEMLAEYEKSKASRTKTPASKSDNETDQSKGDDEGKKAAEQQIIATETVMEGTPLFGQMSVLDGEGPRKEWEHLETIGFGCLLIAMERFSRTPFIGGGYRQGFGRIDFAIDVAFSPDQVLPNAITLQHVHGFPLFTIHPDLQRFRKAGEEALNSVITRLKKEAR